MQSAKERVQVVVIRTHLPATPETGVVSRPGAQTPIFLRSPTIPDQEGGVTPDQGGIGKRVVSGQGAVPTGVVF